MIYKDLPVSVPEFRNLAKNLNEETVRAILDAFYKKMSTDILLGFFFDGKNVDLIAERQGDFLLRAMGVRPSYTGLPPSHAHRKMAPILSGHFDRRLKLLEETLREFGLREDDISVWLGFENAFREPILESRPEA